MKYHTKLEGMLLQRYGGLIFRNSSIWDKNSSVRYAEKELSHKRRLLLKISQILSCQTAFVVSLCGIFTHC